MTYIDNQKEIDKIKKAFIDDLTNFLAIHSKVLTTSQVLEIVGMINDVLGKYQ